MDYAKQLRAAKGNVPYVSQTTSTNSFLVKETVIDGAADEIDRLRSQTQWQPIDTAPKDGTEVLLLVWAFNEVGGERLAVVGRWVEYIGEWVEMVDDGYIYPPIAWMPLPTPPDADREAGE